MKRALVTAFCFAVLWHGVQTVGKGAAKVGKGVGVAVGTFVGKVIVCGLSGDGPCR